MIFYQMLYGKKPFGEDQSQEMCAPHPTDFPHFSFQDVLFCSSKDADDAVAVFRILSQQTILKASLQFPTDPKVSAESKEFIARCLSRDPSNRPTVMQVRFCTTVLDDRGFWLMVLWCV